LEASPVLLPADHAQAILIGRVQRQAGPSPILVRGGEVIDVSATAPTVADLLDRDDIATLAGETICTADALGTDAAPRLLAPFDLQCVKACGVTFAVSALERVIEERARGDAEKAAEIRGDLESRVGSGIRSVVPGTAEAASLKAALIDAGMWSQYLEVAIGPDAEVFTKAPVLSAVGWGADIGIRSDSDWNNPEPEIVLAVNRNGVVRGATLGNDVNLRDFEGRSALLLGKAKDNNASTAIGRDPTELVRQTLSEHQYPDGFALFLGTLFAPVQDRDHPGRGFTHKPGDVVRISTPKLGSLVNRVTTSKDAAPWTFGIRDLMRNLAARGLLSNS
jgi:fumarylacetoacetate (FAA) hydrolase family protein